jgi:hypothetical protein
MIASSTPMILKLEQVAESSKDLVSDSVSWNMV